MPYLYETNLRRFAKRHQHALHRQQLQLRLWQDQDNSFHLKGIWVDNRYQLLTGNNLNPRAFSLDLENGIRHWPCRRRESWTVSASTPDVSTSTQSWKALRNILSKSGSSCDV